MNDVVDDMHLLLTGGYPLDEVIVIDDGSGTPSVVAFIEDAEADVLMLSFKPDGDVEIHTEKYSYVTLFKALPNELEDMIDEAGELWGTLQAYWDEKQENWVGWEHTATQPKPAE